MEKKFTPGKCKIQQKIASEKEKKVHKTKVSVLQKERKKLMMMR